MASRNRQQRSNVRGQGIGKPRKQKVRLLFEQLEDRRLLTAMTPGDLAVVRYGGTLGDPSQQANAALSTSGPAPIFIDEYTPAGVYVQSFAMPTTGATPLTAAGTDFTGDNLTRTENGQELLVTGYDKPVTSSGNPSNDSAAATPRVIGLVNQNGGVDASTQLTDFENGTGATTATIRSAASVDGTSFYVLGANDTNAGQQDSGGLHYVASDGATTSTNLSQNVGGNDNMRQVQIINGNLFMTAGATVPGRSVFEVGTGLPVTEATSAYTALTPLTNTNENNNAFLFLDLSGANGDPRVGGADTLYVTNSGSGGTGPSLDKYSYSSTTNAWTEVSSTSYGGNPSAVGSLYGLTGYNSGSGGVVLYMTTTQGGSGRSQILEYTDTSGYGNPIPNTATFNVLVDLNNPTGIFPTANTVFKGIQFVPSQAPVVTTSTGTASYTEGGAGTVVDPALTLSDPDAVANDISGATVQITSGYVQGEDSLSFTAPGGSGITGFFSAATGTLTLAGTSSIANYQAALQSVKYVDGSQNPSTATRTVSFIASDVSLVASNAATRNVTVTAVNNAPTVTVPGGQTIGTDAGLTFSTANGNAISVADVDGNLAMEQLTLGVNAGTFSLSTTAGLSFSFSDANGTGAGTGINDTTATFRGTIAAIDAALNGMVFAAPGSAQTVTLNATVNDLGNTGTGGALTGTGTVSISVSTHQDAPPVVTTTGTALSYTESAGAVAIDAGITVTDSDSANLTGASVSITSGYDPTQDALNFTPQNGISILSNTGGVLTLTGLSSVANYQAALRSVTYTNSSQNPSAARTVTFAASDGIAPPSTGTRNISIIAVNNPPVNTVPGSQSVGVGQIHVFNSTNGNQISISDVDGGSNTEQVTLSVSAGTVSLSTTAGLSFSFSDSNGTGTGTGTNNTTATFRGTMAAINAALNGLSFTAPATAQAVTLTLTTNDLGNTGTGGPMTATNTVTINAVAKAPLVIEQLMWNPPGTDVPQQYIEIKAIPGLNGSSYAGGVYTIPAGTYLEAIEGDGGPGPNPGSVNDIFDLGGFTTGSDGVLILLQFENGYKDAGFYDVTDPNANVIAETSALGFGNTAVGEASQVNHSAATFATGGNIEDPSVSWFLYQTTIAPTINDDIDANNNGQPGGSIWSNWVVDDSIAVLDSSSDVVDYSYAATTFVDTHGTGQALPGTTVIPIDFTAGFVSRTNNTNGSGPTDWLAANVTGVNPPTSGQPVQFSLDSLQTSLSGYDSLPLDTWNVNTLTAGVTLGNFGNTYVTPVIDINGSTTDGRDYRATFNQGGGAVNVGNSGGLVVTNYGNSSENLTSATVTISNLLDGTSELLSATTTGTPISASYNNTSGVLTLTGPATLAQYQQVLRTIAYNDTASTPNLTPRVINFTATDGTYTSAVSKTTVGMFGNTLPVVRINELDVNPPGNDNPYEYVEIEGPPGQSLNGYYFASVEGDDVDPATATDPTLIGNTGRATYVANLSGYSIGSNGILIIKSPDGGFTPAAGATVVSDPLFDNTGGVLQNGSNSFLLVYSPSTPITAYAYDPTSGTVTSVGTDFDTSGGGTTRDNGTLTMPSGAQLVDNVGWFDGGSSFDLDYGSVVLPLENGAPAAATRIPGDYAQSPSAWYYGTLDPTTNSEVAYNSGDIGPLPASSPNLPLGAMLTPGAPNVAGASPPTVATSNSTGQTYTLGGSAVAVDSGLGVSSTDADITGASMQITNFQTGDALNFTSQNGITGVYSAGTLTLSGSATPAQYQTALQSVTFSTSSTNTTTRTVDVTGDDSAASPTAGNTVADTVNVAIAAPVVTAHQTSLNSTAGQTVSVDTAVTVSSFDTNVTGAVVTISGNFQSGDTLHFTAQNGISIVSNSGGVLTLTGTTTPANYQTALQSITYSSTSTSTLARTVSLVVKDSGDTGNVNSNTATTQINVSAPVTISGLYVSGSAWTSLYKTYLSAHSLGSSTMGYALKTGAAQVTTLPWANINTIDVQFSGPVTGITTGSFKLVGGTGSGSVAAPTITAVSSLGGNAYQISLSGSLGNNKYVLAAASTASSFGPAITDSNGAGISGTFTTTTSSFPSGNGLAGSTFDFFFNVLPGDGNQNALVNASDTALAKSESGFRTTTTGYNPLIDYNGAGLINATDVATDSKNAGARQTTITSPTAPSGAPVGGSGFTALALGVQESGSSSSGTSTPAVANVIPAVTSTSTATTPSSSGSGGSGGATSSSTGSHGRHAFAATDEAVSDFDLTDLWA